MVTRPSEALMLEARSLDTVPERLHELIGLPGDHSDLDSNSGWCRELVAANPAATAGTLTELAQSVPDFHVRKNVAQNPSTPLAILELLTQDSNDFVSNHALERLGRALRCTCIELPAQPQDSTYNTGTRQGTSR